MQLPISDQYRTRPYLAPFSYSTSVTDRQTDERRPWQQLERYRSTVSYKLLLLLMWKYLLLISSKWLSIRFVLLFAQWLIKASLFSVNKQPATLSHVILFWMTGRHLMSLTHCKIAFQLIWNKLECQTLNSLSGC